MGTRLHGVGGGRAPGRSLWRSKGSWTEPGGKEPSRQELSGEVPPQPDPAGSSGDSLHCGVCPTLRPGSQALDPTLLVIHWPPARAGCVCHLPGISWQGSSHSLRESSKDGWSRELLAANTQGSWKVGAPASAGGQGPQDHQPQRPALSIRCHSV